MKTINIPYKKQLFNEKNHLKIQLKNILMKIEKNTIQRENIRFLMNTHIEEAFISNKKGKRPTE